jgi:hypothetical protein
MARPTGSGRPRGDFGWLRFTCFIALKKSPNFEDARYATARLFLIQAGARLLAPYQFRTLEGWNTYISHFSGSSNCQIDANSRDTGIRQLQLAPRDPLAAYRIQPEKRISLILERGDAFFADACSWRRRRFSAPAESVCTPRLGRLSITPRHKLDRALAGEPLPEDHAPAHLHIRPLWTPADRSVPDLHVGPLGVKRVTLQESKRLAP